MDRALAAAVVAAARYLIPAITPDAVAGEIGGYTSIRAMIVKVVLDRAPPANVAGGHAARRAAIDQLPDVLGGVARRQAGNQGTLLGLVEVTRRFVRFSNPLWNGNVYVPTILCAPTATLPPRMRTELLAETSCAARNRFLDRALIVDMVGQKE